MAGGYDVIVIGGGLGGLIARIGTRTLLGFLCEARLSILLFSATFGLSARPTEIGFKRYSTLLSPKWMIRLANHRRSSEVIAGIPADTCRRWPSSIIQRLTAALAGSPTRGSSTVSIAGLRRQSFALISGLPVIVKTICLFATSKFESDESTRGSLPC